MAATTIEIEFIDNNGEANYLDVEFNGEPHSVDVGEDGGEYWGFKYAATTRIIQSCEDTIEWDKSLYNESQNAIIDKYLEDNYEDVDEKICKLLN
jgi:hypothetical protein